MDGYGYYPRTAVAGDLLQALSNLQSKRNMSIEVKDVVAQRDPATNGNLPPIVLVHGIFGFGKGRLGGLSYFAGAEKKDERVLVPDLGSLTSIYDRFVLWSLKVFPFSDTSDNWLARIELTTSDISPNSYTEKYRS
ncbi:hypothetical protein ACFX1X_036739 [Malus domestica]